MISTTPSASEVDATMNLLSVLELAKDAAALKASLSALKAAHDAAAAERAAAAKATADAAAALDEVAAAKALLAQEEARIRQQDQRSFKASADIALEHDNMRRERNEFDRWMAGEREALAADRAKVESVAAANAKRAGEMDQREAQADSELASARALQAAAEKLRSEYEQKIATLKSMI